MEALICVLLLLAAGAVRAKYNFDDGFYSESSRTNTCHQKVINGVVSGGKFTYETEMSLQRTL